MHHWSSKAFHYPAYFTYFYLDSFRSTFQITSCSIRDIQKQSFRFLLKGCTVLKHMDVISLVMGLTPGKQDSQGAHQFYFRFAHAVSGCLVGPSNRICVHCREGWCFC